MGSNNPVPSRAAIHALRGLVFGTSCSVVLIAEERRRRLKTVRAAAENARKIHAAKTHRALSTSDGLSAWEARLLHRNEEVLASAGESPSPRNFRRPEPDKKRARTRTENHSIDADENAKPNDDAHGSPAAAGKPTFARHKKTEVSNVSAQDAISRAASDGLSAWVNRLAGGSIASISPATSAAKVENKHILTELAIRAPSLSSRGAGYSENQRTPTAAQVEASSNAWKLVDHSMHKSSLPLQHRPRDSVDPANDSVMEGMEEPLTNAPDAIIESRTERSVVKERGPIFDAGFMAAAGDGLAKWELLTGVDITPSIDNTPSLEKTTRDPKWGEQAEQSAVSTEVTSQTHYSTQQTFGIPALTSYTEHHASKIQSLVQAGDALASWQVQFQQHQLARLKAPWANPASQSKQTQDSAEATQHIGAVRNAELDPTQSEQPSEHRGELPFELDKNNRFQPTFQISEIGEVSQTFIDRIENSEMQAIQPGLVWSQCCLLLEKMLAVHAEGEHDYPVHHLRSLVSFMSRTGSTAPEDFQYRPYDISLKVFQRTSQERPSRLEEYLLLLKSIGMDETELLRDIIAWTVRCRHPDILREVLNVLQQDSMSHVWQGGWFLTTLLGLSVKSPLPPQEFFASLQAAGFAQDSLPSFVLTEFRRRILTPEAVARHDTLALAILQTIDEQGSMGTDLTVARALLVRDAHHASADDVLKRVEGVRRLPEGESWLRSWWLQLVNIFVLSHESAENVVLLKGMYAMEPFALQQSWVEQPLKDYSETGDLDNFIDWLSFSVQSGFQFDTQSASKLTALLTEKWSVPLRDIEKVLPAIKPYLIPANDLEKVRAQQIGPPDHHVFTQMRQQCHEKNWHAAITIFDNSLAQDLPFSGRCLGMAVTACLERDGPSSEAARYFVESASSQGHDVTDQRRRLLIASCKSGRRPGQALTTALEQGLKMSAEAYIVVARECIERKQWTEALQICERRASEFGNGKLGYDEQNFSALLRIYVLLGTPSAYEALGRLVTDFISEPRWWHRSKLCKETIKHQQKRLLSERRADPRLIEAVKLALAAAQEHIAESRARSGNPDWIMAEVIAILQSGKKVSKAAKQAARSRDWRFRNSDLAASICSRQIKSPEVPKTPKITPQPARQQERQPATPSGSDPWQALRSQRHVEKIPQRQLTNGLKLDNTKANAASVEQSWEALEEQAEASLQKLGIHAGPRQKAPATSGRAKAKAKAKPEFKETAGDPVEDQIRKLMRIA
ncbi:hypothetical protein NLU13_0792 [Sarocladium strictum]|uniref:Uncharacterized protein n=1 Tax=Sarocladium strictum TaxID=5046 RepID=A0AA39LB48_SARSR|nr:hypothetical protein NLU13_0792 [Sarocladium strictum]